MVSLRQAERAGARERQRGAELLATSESHYQRQIESLQARLAAASRDRTVMAVCFFGLFFFLISDNYYTLFI